MLCVPNVGRVRMDEDARGLKWVVSGRVARAAAAELVGLCRSLLIEAHSRPLWTQAMRRAVSDGLLRTRFRRAMGSKTLPSLTALRHALSHLHRESRLPDPYRAQQ